MYKLKIIGNVSRVRNIHQGLCSLFLHVCSVQGLHKGIYMNDTTTWKITWQNRMLKCYKKENGALVIFLNNNIWNWYFRSFFFVLGYCFRVQGIHFYLGLILFISFYFLILTYLTINRDQILLTTSHLKREVYY